MTPERQAEFLALISKGESIGGACRRLKISSSRVNTFRNAHRDFDAQVRQAFADSAVKRQEIFRQRSTAWRPRSGVPSRPVEGKKVPAIVEPFLAELAHGASVTAAAEYAGVSRAMVFRWRRDDPEFALRWDEAVQMGVDRGSRTRRTGARSTAWRDRCIRAAPRSARYANIPTSCCWLARCQF